MAMAVRAKRWCALGCVVVAVCVVLASHVAPAGESDPRRAAELFRLGLGVFREISPENGAEILAEAVKLDPGNALYVIYLADAQYLSGDRSAGNKTAGKVFKLLHDQSLMDLHEGKRALRREKQEAALFDFREALLAKPNEHAFYELAALEIKRGELDEAATDLAIGLKLFPDDYYLNNLMGNARYGQKRYAEALESFEAAIQANSVLPWARINRGLTRHIQGDHEEALKDFDAVLSVYPDQDKAKYFKVLALEKLKRYGAARTIVDALAEAKPDDLALTLQRGWLYGKTDKVRDGIELLEKYVEGMPDDAEGHYKLATLHAGRKKKSQAYTRLRRALELDRTQTLLWLHADPEWDRYRDTKNFRKLVEE